MNDILLGKGESQVHLRGEFGNRHGMIAGATGTGKSVSLMVLAEGFSRMGVPVFVADVKGDFAGLSMPGKMHPKIQERIDTIGIEGYENEANPVVFWDVFGKQGHPMRTTVSEMGPVLLARILELNEAQQGVLEVAFAVADDRGYLLLDFEDLKAILAYVTEERKAISTEYGLVHPASIAAIQRALLRLDQAEGDHLFGEPALALSDLMRQDMSGRGIINILAADKLVLKPRLYSTVLLWLLSELFEEMPEVGDADKPKMVFFFDEAHLLFQDAPKALLDRVEQVVRIIRSKGIGVYFCSQYPDDMPDDVLGQLGNRVQHALRAYTPRDQKALRAAAQTFVENPKLDVEDVLGQLGVGEALVSTLQDKGIPMPVQQTLMCPPRCRMGSITAEERATVMSRSPVGSIYNQVIDRDSAAEVLQKRAEDIQKALEEGKDKKTPDKAKEEDSDSALHRWLFGTKRRQGVLEAMGKSVARNVGGKLGRQIVRGILGGLMR